MYRTASNFTVERSEQLPTIRVSQALYGNSDYAQKEASSPLGGSSPEGLAGKALSLLSQGRVVFKGVFCELLPGPLW